MGGVELELDEGIAAVIRDLFERRGRRMPENNLRQAMVPVGATVIPQTRGTAPGLICPVGDKVVYAVPGVPHEMYDMVERAVVPDLRARSGITETIASRQLKTWGESESGLNERLDALIARLDVDGDATIAFLARGWEGLVVRLTTRQPDAEAAAAVLDRYEAEVRALLGPLVFGVDDETMETVVLDALRARGLTLAVAESLTGGLVAGRLTAIPGCSDVLRGAVVSYASEVKYDLLGVSSGPVVNEPAAIEMAEGVQRLLGADVGLSLTGVAGPTEQDGVEVGTVCIAIALPTGSHATTVRLGSLREQIRQFAVINSLDLLRRRLQLADAT
jgi:nicotinamide-nucleotide amidase